MNDQTVQRVVRIEINAETGDGFLGALDPQRFLREMLSTCDLRTGFIDKAAPGGTDWWGWSEVIDEIARRATEPRSDGRTLDVHLATYAPLPLLIQLGARLTQWGPAVTVHSMHGGKWYAIRTDVGVSADDYFGEVSPLDRRSEASGWVALAVDAIGGGIDPQHIRDALKQDLLDIVHVARPEGDLESDNADRFIGHVQRVLKRYPACFPNADGLAIFYRGPAPGAVLLGRQINTATHSRVRLYDFDLKRDPHYTLAVELPRGRRAPPAVDWSDSARLRRRDAWQAIAGGLTELQADLEPDHLPRTVPDRGKVIARLATLRLDPPPTSDGGDDAFVFEAGTTGRVRLDAGLLDALSSDPQIDLRLAGQMFLLHELLHVDQGIFSSTYRGIGRAGVVLEDVDYHADAFAVGVVIDHEVREQGRRGERQRGQIAARCVEVHIRILEAFDRAEQGPRILRLAERRLRRYLIWHMQRQRLAALAGASDIAAADVLAERLTVELAPLAGHLDARHDKFVDRATAETELFVSLLGNLVRVQRSAVTAGGRDPSALVEAVRAFDWAPIARVMQAAVDGQRDVLVSWRP